MNSNKNTLQKLSEDMRCGIFTNASGKIVIIHDKQIKINLSWIEYDENLKQTFLVYDNGNTQELGIVIPDSMLKSLSSGRSISLLHLINGRIHSSQETSFIYIGQ